MTCTAKISLPKTSDFRFQIIGVIKIKHLVSHGAELYAHTSCGLHIVPCGGKVQGCMRQVCARCGAHAQWCRPMNTSSAHHLHITGCSTVVVTECLLILPTRERRSSRTWSPSSGSGESLSGFLRMSLLFQLLYTFFYWITVVSVRVVCL